MVSLELVAAGTDAARLRAAARSLGGVALLDERAEAVGLPFRGLMTAVTDDVDALLAAAGRPGSPLGARALLLDRPGLLIHGTNSPKTIGHLVASGCIRLVNDDVEDLYRRVSVETRVVFAS